MRVLFAFCVKIRLPHQWFKFQNLHFYHSFIHLFVFCFCFFQMIHGEKKKHPACKGLDWWAWAKVPVLPFFGGENSCGIIPSRQMEADKCSVSFYLFIMYLFTHCKSIPFFQPAKFSRAAHEHVVESLTRYKYLALAQI